MFNFVKIIFLSTIPNKLATCKKIYNEVIYVK